MLDVFLSSQGYLNFRQRLNLLLSVFSEQHTMLFGGTTQCRTKAEDGKCCYYLCLQAMCQESTELLNANFVGKVPVGNV